MFDSEEQRTRAEFIIMTLAKLYVLLEFSPDACPVCRNDIDHDVECPLALAWSLLDNDQQHHAKSAMRALALTIGRDDSSADSIAH